jgi:hypothetical protein
MTEASPEKEGGAPRMDTFIEAVDVLKNGSLGLASSFPLSGVSAYGTKLAL